MYKLLIVLFTWFTCSAKAQSLEELQKKYEGNIAVFTKNHETLNILFKDDSLVAESVEEEEFMLLDEKAIGVLNKYKVYHSSFSELKKVEAYTLVDDGSKKRNKIIVESFKTQNNQSNSIFYSDSKETSFDFPQVTKGSICNAKATKYFKDIHLLKPFYFNNYLPVDNLKYTVIAPENVELKYLLKNNDNNFIQVNQYKKGKNIYYEFSAQKLMPILSTASSVNMAYFAPHVIVYVSSFTKNNKKSNVFSSLNDLYSWNVNFLKNLNKEPSETLKKLVDSLTFGINEPKQKALIIYQWVQSHIKYVAFEDGLEGFIPRQAIDVCNKRYGDCKDMSSLLTVMLKLANIDAYYTWIGTRKIPYKYTEVWLPLTDNHMICTAKINDEWIYLDGTDADCIFGYPSIEIQGKQALIAINENEYKVGEVPIIDFSKNKLIDSTFITIEGSSLKGLSSIYYNGYLGSNMYGSLNYNKEKEDEKEFVKAKLYKASNNFKLNTYDVKKMNDIEKTVNLIGNFEIPNYVKNVSNEIYLNMNLDKFFLGSKLDTSKVKVPLKNDFGSTIQQFIILTIPDNYQVSFMPNDLKISNDIFDISINYFIQNNKLIASQKIAYKPLIIKVSDFSIFNQTIQKMSAYYKEQIVLQKK